MRARVWTRTDRQSFAMKGDLGFRQRATHDFEPFQQLRVAFVQRNAESAKLERAESGSDANHRPSAAQVIDPTDFLGQSQRMVQRHDRYSVANQDALRSLRD